MSVRVPAIVEEVLANNPDYDPEIHSAVRVLADELRRGDALPWLGADAPNALEWHAELATRNGQGWLDTDWFFAETYAYRQLIERTRYWQTRRDPFRAHKRAEYSSDTFARALAEALSRSHGGDERLLSALLGSLFGNRIDLSFRASRERGIAAGEDDLLVDARNDALQCLRRGTGSVHLIMDNAGTELALDLVLVDALLTELGAAVTLHVKVHPTFVSDATEADVTDFLQSREHDQIPLVSAFKQRLQSALDSGRLAVRGHPYWNGPLALWDLPDILRSVFDGARLVISKGDANYRRALNDALWPNETTFEAVTRDFPAPLLALRTLKSDPVVDLTAVQVRALDEVDPTWRVNGRRGVISLGGGRADSTVASS